MSHKSINKRQLQNDIFGIHTTALEYVSQPYEFYQQLMGISFEQRRHVKSSILNERPLVTHQQGERLLDPGIGHEVKRVMWSIHGDRAHGPLSVVEVISSMIDGI